MTTHFGYPRLEKAFRALGCWSFGLAAGLSLDILIGGQASRGDLATDAFIATASVVWCWNDWD